MSFIKNWALRKIEKNANKSIMTWKDVNGVEHQEEVIMKRSNMPILGDWTRIYPPISEDGEKVNYMNLIFGGKRNFIKLLIYLGIAIIIFLAFKEVTMNYNALMNNQCVLNCVNKIVP